MNSQHKGCDSLAECLEELLLYFNCKVDPASIYAGLPVVGKKLLPTDFQRAAQKAGLVSDLSVMPLCDLKADHLPAVLLLDDDQVCIVYQINHQTNEFAVKYPGEPRRQVSRFVLEFDFTGYLLGVKAPHGSQPDGSETSHTRPYQWFWSNIKPFWKTYRDVLLASFLINLFALASPLFVMNVYDRVVPNQAYETLWLLALGVVLAFVFDYVIKIIRANFVDLAGKRIDLNLSAQLMEKILGLKLSSRPAATGSFMNNLAEFDHIRTFINSATILTLIDLPFVVLFLALIAWIAPPLVAVPLSCMALAGMIAWFINKPLQQKIEESQQATNQRQVFLLETLIGLETLKTSSSENMSQYQWEQHNRHVADISLGLRKLQLISSQSATFILQLGTVLIVASGVYLIGAGELSMGGLIATMMISGRCTAPVVQSISLLNSFQKTRQALDHTESILSLPQERPSARHFLRPKEIKGAIEIRHLSFGYPDSPPLLKELDITIKEGEKVALLGRMGAGKTTLLQILLGLWEPVEGSLSVDGLDLRQIDPSVLRQHVGYVPQKIDIFAGTIRDNLILGRQNVTDDQLITVVQQAGLGELFKNHPEGLDFQVGESGRRLSGGQIQSIGVARALLGEPRILLLDEPTSSMDSHAEALFKQTIKSLKNTTVILVTHKMSMIDLVDQVMVIEQGRVIAKRAAVELVKQKQPVAGEVA